MELILWFLIIQINKMLIHFIYYNTSAIKNIACFTMQLDFNHIFQEHTSKAHPQRQNPQPGGFGKQSSLPTQTSFNFNDSSKDASLLASGHRSWMSNSLFTNENHHEEIKNNSKGKAMIKILQQSRDSQDEQTNQDYEWYKRTDAEIYQSMGNKKRVKKEYGKKDIQSITNRLTKATGCSKEKCKLISDHQFRKKIQEQNLPYPHRRKHEKTLTEVCEFYQKNPKSETHERLYREHLQKEFNEIELNRSYKEKRDEQNQGELYENPQYLTNYVKFYNRLDKEVSLRVMKEKLYGNMSKNNVFHPNIQASKRSLEMLTMKPKFKPKQMKKPLKGAAQMRQSSQEPIPQPTRSIMKQSLNILDDREYEFIEKVCQLFNYDGEFVVTPEGVQQLNEKQFQTIFPLINRLEEEGDSISIEIFEQELRQHYTSLSIMEKRAIREREHRRKQCCTGRLISLSFFQNKVETNNTKKKAKHKDYLKKIQNFV